MILRQYRSLGILPEVIVFAFLFGLVSTISYTIWKVCSRSPVMLVNEADGVHRLVPAHADDGYMRSFADNFLQNWATWNHYNYQYRKSVAIGMMTPAVRHQFEEMSKTSSGLVTSLQQSQSFALGSLTLRVLDAPRGYVQADFVGTTRVFYGGVGGDPDPYRGALLLHAITPTVTDPLCLEVLGFRIDRDKATP